MGSIASVERCLDVLETLSGEADGLSLGTIAERLDLPKSAAHRLLTALLHRRFVTQDAAGESYSLSFRLAQLGFRRLDALRYPEVAQPVLDRLAADTGEHVRLAVVEGDSMTWVARAQGASRGLRYDPEMGQSVVLHATATGKAWLATLSLERALEIVVARGFDVPAHFTGRSVRTAAALRAQLGETRRRGYGLAIEEGEWGTAALAAVVRDGEAPDAPVVATISVAGPVTRLAGAARQRAADLMIAATGEMSALWPVRRRQRKSGANAPGASTDLTPPRLRRTGTSR
ncbi:MAG: IclR family transcriptional regulator [Alphaproteobacteria bacterium]|nr:IclR family transcriptional regulator [Alphaproteobacteria bacterium]